MSETSTAQFPTGSETPNPAVAGEPCPQGRTDYEACFAPFRYCPVKGCGRAEGDKQLPTEAMTTVPEIVPGSDDHIRNLLDIAQKRAESAQEKRFVLDPATWPTPHRHYNDVRVNGCGHDLHYGWLEIAQEIEDVQQLMDFVGVPDGLPQGKGDADWRVAVAVIRLMDAEARLGSIAAAHARETADGGMVGDYCVECERRWPCPTYRWANGDTDTSDSWEGSDGT